VGVSLVGVWSVTQQYIVGEFSVLLSELEVAAGGGAGAVRDLRWEVEHSPVGLLAGLARRSLEVTDGLCWSALEQGDVAGFRACSWMAVALAAFARNAGLLAG
jgi:hypothetical protein